jgi:CspA family cold shock protein
MEEREVGTVKWFDAKKGYGFITRDTGGDIFVHFSAIKGTGFRALEESQKVEFTVTDGEKGLQAQEVRVL